MLRFEWSKRYPIQKEYDRKYSWYQDYSVSPTRRHFHISVTEVAKTWPQVSQMFEHKLFFAIQMKITFVLELPTNVRGLVVFVM